LFRRFFVDAFDLLKFCLQRGFHSLTRAEMLQQRTFARGSDAGDLVEYRFTDGVAALDAMRTDGEAMRLIAQTLKVMQHRIVRLQLKGRAVRHMEPFAPCVPVGRS